MTNKRMKCARNINSPNISNKMKKSVLVLMAMMSVLGISAQGIYDITVKDDLGRDVPMADY